MVAHAGVFSNSRDSFGFGSFDWNPTGEANIEHRLHWKRRMCLYLSFGVKVTRKQFGQILFLCLFFLFFRLCAVEMFPSIKLQTVDQTLSPELTATKRWVTAVIGWNVRVWVDHPLFSYETTTTTRRKTTKHFEQSLLTEAQAHQPKRSLKMLSDRACVFQHVSPLCIDAVKIITHANGWGLATVLCCHAFGQSCRWHRRTVWADAAFLHRHHRASVCRHRPPTVCLLREP